LDLPHRAVEVGEDPPDFLFEGRKGSLAKGLDTSPDAFLKDAGGDAVGRLEREPFRRHGDGEELPLRDSGLDFPAVVRGKGDGDRMVALPLLVGFEDDPEGEDPEASFPRFRHNPIPRVEGHARLLQGVERPRLSGDLVPAAIPPPSGGRTGEDALEEVAARGHELGPELPGPLRIEYETVHRGNLEVPLQ
jgi:hypothetical protein